MLFTDAVLLALIGVWFYFAAKYLCKNGSCGTCRACPRAGYGACKDCEKDKKEKG